MLIPFFTFNFIIYIKSSGRFLLACPAFFPPCPLCLCSPLPSSQGNEDSIVSPKHWGWKAARVVWRVQVSLWISCFRGLPVTFLVLLLLRCLAQQRWLPQTATGDAAGQHIFPLGSGSVEPLWPWSCPSLWSRESTHPDHQGGMAAAPERRATDSHCSYPDFNSVSWISVS